MSTTCPKCGSPLAHTIGKKDPGCPIKCGWTAFQSQVEAVIERALADRTADDLARAEADGDLLRSLGIRH